jgi:hypothetical protein
MQPEMIFNAGNLLAVTGWVGLLIALFAAPARRFALVWAAITVPALLAAAYVALLIGGREAFAEGGFGSIAEVRALFAHDAALTAGWLHYLAFDLFVGAWIVRTGLDRGISRWLVLPCLPLTFLFGPTGLLLFFVFHAAARPRELLS